MEEKKTILDVKHLRVDFTTDQGTVQAVRDVSFSVKEGEILGIVGESGSGKSVTMYSVMGLLAQNGSINEGEIVFNGESIARKDFPDNRSYEKKMREIRGNTMAMIFQDPMTFLNPVLTIGKQIRETLLNHNPKMTKKEANERAIELMRQVGIPAPEKRINQYPFEFSGGMRQRAMVAMGISAGAKLILADEPSKGLDEKRVSLVVEAFEQLKEESLLCVTHDMMFAGRISDHICVLYAAQQVEYGPTEEILKNPLHPYTQDMILAIPENGMKVSMTGFAPPHTDYQNYGCRYKHRCRFCTSKCDTMPPVFTLGDRKVRCWKYENEN